MTLQIRLVPSLADACTISVHFMIGQAGFVEVLKSVLSCQGQWCSHHVLVLQ